MALSFIQQKFFTEAGRAKRRIAIGIWHADEQIISSLRRAVEYADLTVVGCSIDGLQCIPTKDDDEASVAIVQLVKEKTVDGFVRGQLKDSYTYKQFLSQIGRHGEAKIVPIIVAHDEYFTTVTNGSYYNSLNAAQQYAEASRIARYYQEELRIKPTIAVMSTRRPSGLVGEYPLLEQIAKNNIETADRLRADGHDVKEYYIEYERAVWEGRNVIVGAIGMIANTWLKALTLLGGWTFVHGPYLDLGAYYDDTARNVKDWFWPIVSTVAWINRHEK